MTLASNIIAKIKADETVAGDLETSSSSFADRLPIQLADGTGSRQADLKWSDTRTVGTGGETLDFNALVDSLGRTRNFVKVKAIHIRAADANSSTIVVGNNLTNPFVGPFDDGTVTITLPAGAGIMIWNPVSGWSSANGSLDKLQIVGGAAGPGLRHRSHRDERIMLANPARGEVDLEIGGEPFVVAATFASVSKLQAKLEVKGLAAIVAKLQLLDPDVMIAAVSTLAISGDTQSLSRAPYNVATLQRIQVAINDALAGPDSKNADSAKTTA
jgi:hypothetical protein